MPHTRTPDEAREDCYAQVQTVMKEGIKQYYQKHPERLDERAYDALEFSMIGLRRIFSILDTFDIRYPEDK